MSRSSIASCFLLFGLVLSLVACTPGGDSKSKPKSCDPAVDTKRCSGSLSVQICDEDSSNWKTEEICGAGQECSGTGEAAACAALAPDTDVVSTPDAAADAQPDDALLPESSCNDGTQNGDETYIDCGGSCPVKCDDTRPCVVAADCKSGCCSPDNVCAPDSDSDGVCDSDDQCASADDALLNEDCSACLDSHFAPPTCTTCSEKFKGDSCDECVDPIFAGSECDECANDVFTGDNCDECAEPKYTGDNCDECADPKYTGDNCDECADPKYTGDNCDECAEKFAGANCDECANPMNSVGVHCDAWLPCDFWAQDCSQGYGCYPTTNEALPCWASECVSCMTSGGTSSAGQACVHHQDCAKGLICGSGTCRKPCSITDFPEGLCKPLSDSPISCEAQENDCADGETCTADSWPEGTPSFCTDDCSANGKDTQEVVPGAIGYCVN